MNLFQWEGSSQNYLLIQKKIESSLSEISQRLRILCRALYTESQSQGGMINELRLLDADWQEA